MWCVRCWDVLQRQRVGGVLPLRSRVLPVRPGQQRVPRMRRGQRPAESGVHHLPGLSGWLCPACHRGLRLRCLRGRLLCLGLYDDLVLGLWSWYLSVADHVHGLRRVSRGHLPAVVQGRRGSMSSLFPGALPAGPRGYGMRGVRRGELPDGWLCHVLQPVPTRVVTWALWAGYGVFVHSLHGGDVRLRQGLFIVPWVRAGHVSEHDGGLSVRGLCAGYLSRLGERLCPLPGWDVWYGGGRLGRKRVHPLLARLVQLGNSEHCQRGVSGVRTGALLDGGRAGLGGILCGLPGRDLCLSSRGLLRHLWDG